MAAPVKSKYDEYPDDIFKESRMSFGEHIEELRSRMFKAIKWLLFFLLFGFILDGIGDALDKPNLGVGKPMLKIITDPVESQTRDFYNRRNEKNGTDKLTQLMQTPGSEIREIEEKLKKAEYNTTALTSDERAKLLGAPQIMPVIVTTEQFVPAFGPPKPDAPSELSLNLQVYPAYISYMSNKGDVLMEGKQYLSTLSVQEGFVIYFKVSVICAIVLASPFMLFQFWAFVGAGLYPHEKKYVYSLFGPSVGLFIAGILLCQFFVLPGAVKALLTFNEWLGFDPEIRLREWLSLALILPLVFGISFQTPLVMVALYRVGIFSPEAYLAKWRHAVMIIAVFAAVITPTPDAITMMYLFVPMMALYMIGIGACYLYPGRIVAEEPTEADEEVAV
jgi:sec-independent protein translocase protein TatC